MVFIFEKFINFIEGLSPDPQKIMGYAGEKWNFLTKN